MYPPALVTVADAARQRRRCGAQNVSVHRVPQVQGVGRAGVFLYVKCPTTLPMRCPKCQRSQGAAGARRRARRRIFRTSSARQLCRCGAQNVSVHRVPQVQGVGRAGVFFVRQVPDNSADAVPKMSAFTGCRRCKASGAPAYFSYVKCPTTPQMRCPVNADKKNALGPTPQRRFKTDFGNLAVVALRL